MPSKQYIAPFDREAVLKLAQNLRGRLCSRITEQPPQCGSFNWALIVIFDDGVKWVFRTPRRDPSGPQLPIELLSDLIASEAATLRFLSQHSSVPVPTIHDYSCTTLNPVGVPYILMDCAAGLSLASLLRHTSDDKHDTRSCENRKKVMEQLGKISFELSKLRFSKIGSLFENNGQFHIQHSLAPGFYFHDRHLLSIDRGPFLREQDYYRSLTNAFMQHVQELSMGYHYFRAPVPSEAEYEDFESYRYATDLWNDFMVVGDKLESSENRLNYYAAGKIIDSVLPNFILPSYVEAASCAGSGFPLCHLDLSTGNIFLDENYNITCIIDWEFSSTVPLAQLLAAPGLPHPRDLPSPEDKESFRAGFESAHAAKGIDPPLWTLADKIWHFMRWVNMDSLCDYDHFEFLCGIESPLKLVRSMRQGTHMRIVEADMVSEDLDSEGTEHQEAEYFSTIRNGGERHEVAKRLTEHERFGDVVMRASFWLP